MFVIWIPLTLLTYVCKKQWQVLLLGGIQLVFFILVIYFLFRNPGKKNAMQSTLDQLDAFGSETTDVSDADDAADADDATETADDTAADAEPSEASADTQAEEDSDSDKD